MVFINTETWSRDEITENGVTFMIYGEMGAPEGRYCRRCGRFGEQQRPLRGVEGLVPELHIIGDSVAPRNSLFAIHEGFKVGNRIPGSDRQRLRRDIEGIKGRGNHGRLSGELVQKTRSHSLTARTAAIAKRLPSKSPQIRQPSCGCARHPRVLR